MAVAIQVLETFGVGLVPRGSNITKRQARALRWSDVDMKQQTAVIRASADNQDSTIGPTKTRKIRVIEIDDEPDQPAEILTASHSYVWWSAGMVDADAEDCP